MSEVNQWLLNAARFFAVSVFFFLPISIAAVNAACALFALSVFANRRFWGDLSALWRLPVVKASMLLFLAIMLATIYSSAPLAEAFDFGTKYRKLLFIPLLVWVFRHSVSGLQARWTLLAGLVVMLVLSYTNYFGWTDLFRPRDYDITDMAVVFHNRISQGAFMTLLFCLAVTMSRKAADHPLKLGLAAIAVLAAINVMLLTNSRSGQIYFIVVSLWMTLAKSRRLYSQNPLKAVAFAALAAMLLGGLLVSSMQQQTSRMALMTSELKHQFQTGNETTAGMRLEFYALSWKIIKAHPLFGSGTGSIAIESDRMISQKQTTLTATMQNPHNEYLAMMIQMGVLGIALFTWLLCTVYFGARHLLWQDREVLQSYVLIFAVGCTLNSLLLDFNEGHMLVFLAGIFLAPLYSEKRLPVTV